MRTVRKVSNTLLRQHTLNDEDLLCEVDAIINERPIRKVPDDSRVTANHALSSSTRRAGSSTEQIPERRFELVA